MGISLHTLYILKSSGLKNCFVFIFYLFIVLHASKKFKNLNGISDGRR